MFNELPADMLNSFGISIHENTGECGAVFLHKDSPAIQSVFCNSEIRADGTMAGTTEINSYSYNKINALKEFRKDGAEKYINYLRGNDNDVKISAFEREGMDIDTLPLIQRLNMNAALPVLTKITFMLVRTNLYLMERTLLKMKIVFPILTSVTGTTTL